MNKTIIFRKIGGIISEITEQYQYLSVDPENINPLELELFVANSHFLSEHLAILKKLDASTGPESSRSKLNTPEQLQPIASQTTRLPGEYEDHSESNVPEPAIFNQADEIRGVPAGTKDDMWFEPVSDSQVLFSSVSITEDTPQVLSRSDAAADVSELVEEAAPEPPQPAFAEEKSAISSEIINETKYVEQEKNQKAMSLVEIEPVKEADSIKLPEPVRQTEIAQEAKPIVESLPLEDKIYQQQADNNNTLTVERVPTLNEILSAGKNKDIPIPNMNFREDRDLKSMIKLNDKLMFVRDLFNGYSLAYSEAIDLVNRFDNFKSADNFLKQNYAEKNRWSEKQNSVDQFYEILNKRFS